MFPQIAGKSLIIKLTIEDFINHADVLNCIAELNNIIKTFICLINTA